MLFVVPMSFLADVDQFDPFHEVPGAPFKYPGSYEPGRELNNQVRLPKKWAKALAGSTNDADKGVGRGAARG
jgi:hypothetical protein